MEQKVTQIEAAQRQLRTAIELWFADGDAVSVHTLAMAAHQVVHDLNRKNNGEGLLFDSEFLPEDFKKKWRRIITEPSAFFKHADFRKHSKKPEIAFNPDVNEGIILFSLWGLGQLKASFGATEDAFLVWNRIHSPDVLKPLGDLPGHGVPVEGIEQLRTLEKGQFLKMFLEARRTLAH